MGLQTYAVDQLVWAKVAGFPHWPAKIEAEEDLPPHVVKSKPSATTTSKPVYFFGSCEFGWVPQKDLKDFDENFADLSKKSKSKQFLKGIDEIRNKDFWPQKGQFDNYSEQLALLEDVYDTFEGDAEVGEGEGVVEKKKKRSINAEGGEKKKRKREEEVKKTVSKSEVSPKDRLMRLRMKLQVFLQKRDEYTDDDYKIADKYLAETEKVQMDIDMFKDTKIGKVIKHLSKKNILKSDISLRCKKLTDKWINELQSELVQGGGEDEAGSAVQDTPMEDSTSNGNLPSSPKREPSSSPKKSHHHVEEKAVDTPAATIHESSPKASSPKREVGSPKQAAALVSEKTEASRVPSPKRDANHSPVSPKKATIAPNSLPKKEVVGSPKKEAPGSPKKEAPGSPKMMMEVDSPKMASSSTAVAVVAASPKKQKVEGDVPATPLALGGSSSPKAPSSPSKKEHITSPSKSTLSV